jgi:glycosyltransferase involved in cell wall biosynthesis
MLSHKDTIATIKSANAFVLNSSYEGLSHLLIETQALGVPTVATNIGGNPEVITNGKNGFLISLSDTTKLTEMLDIIVSDEELCAKLSANALKSSDRFSLETMIVSIASALKNL